MFHIILIHPYYNEQKEQKVALKSSSSLPDGIPSLFSCWRLNLWLARAGLLRCLEMRRGRRLSLGRGASRGLGSGQGQGTAPGRQYSGEDGGELCPVEKGR